MITSEESDLELIVKELGELFTEESPFQIQMNVEKFIRSLNIEELLK